MIEVKECAMIETKPDKPHAQGSHDFHCKCSECGTEITAEADFDKNEKLIGVRFPMCICPNCKALIEKFVSYHGE